MERESFEDPATAQVLNENFIPIKVDREEHPAVDDLYMMAVQVTTGRGGWPMSVWLEPEKLRPFLAGTYFPPAPKHGLPSFTELLHSVAEAWRERRDGVLQQAERIADAVQGQLAAKRDRSPLGAAQVHEAVNHLLNAFDHEHGGFGRAPKFPQPVYFDLLFAARAVVDDEVESNINHAIRFTLDRMATGGMYDQVGGGFHRYAVDRAWRVPHFEKMLYDQAQLASVYARAYGLWGDFYYAQIARETLRYVDRELGDSAGGFFSAQDAEVNAREGGNYVWTPEQVRAALHDAGEPTLVEFASNIYGLNDGPNFRDPHHPEDAPTNVLYLLDRPEVLAAQMGIPTAVFNERRTRVNEALRAARDQRDQPLTDDKVILAWNGLMIAAFAEVGRRLDDSALIERAIRAAEFVWKHMRSDDGEWHRTVRQGTPGPGAVLEDEACLLRGVLELASATGDTRWLRRAIDLARRINERYGDSDAGGFFDTRAEQSDLFVRARSSYDGAMPSGAGVMIENLIQLFEMTGERIFLDDALRALESISAAIAEGPHGTAISTAAIAWLAAMHPDVLPAPGAAPADHPAGISPAQPSPSDRSSSPVQFISSVEHLTVPREGSLSCSLILLLDSAYWVSEGHANMTIEGDGWSLRSHWPPPELLAPEDDQGRSDAASEAGESMRGWRGAVYVPVELRAGAEVSPRATIRLRVTVCTIGACLPEMTLTLPVEAD